jgi:hypothetical protein
MAQHDDFVEDGFKESKDDQLDEALNLTDLLNMASGLRINTKNVQDSPIEDTNESQDLDSETTLITNSESFNMNEMFNMASQLMNDPHFFENLSGLVNDGEQKETTEAFIPLPLNLPEILNMVGGLSNGLNGFNSPVHASQFELTILKELEDFHEQIEKLNESILDLKEELSNLAKNDKANPNSLLDS